jgi:hypothetical protein
MFRARKAGRRAMVRWADTPEPIGLALRGQSRGTVITLASSARKLDLLRLRSHRPRPDRAAITPAPLTRAADG